MNVLATPYASIRTKLVEEIAAAPWPSPEAGFLEYLNTTIGAATHDHPLVTERLEETPMLASAGYQYASARFIRPKEYDEQWAQHFRRLASKQAFPIDRESYFFRPLDLLGLCIGAHYCPSITDEDRAWLRAVLEQGRNRLPDGSRAYYLGSLAAFHLGVAWPVQQPRTEDLPLSTLCLLYWITDNEPLAKATDIKVPAPALASTILSRALMTAEHYDDLADAGLILYVTAGLCTKSDGLLIA